MGKGRCHRGIQRRLAWSKSGKDGNTAEIIKRAGYRGVFTLMGREHSRFVTAAKTRGEGSRKRRATRDTTKGRAINVVLHVLRTAGWCA